MLDGMRWQGAAISNQVINPLCKVTDCAAIVGIIKGQAPAPGSQKVGIAFFCDKPALFEEQFGIRNIAPLVQNPYAPLTRVGFGVAGMPADRRVVRRRLIPAPINDGENAVIAPATHREPGV